ncbi:hypothetical protein HYC85_017462 [Camellia sinensis]|uniref:Pectate lyase n=1 Tax=Camellia sinensis TaxID=4442 RepID=A0A7J7GT76_CAMSI|nr:hypothetical protein HYC85_017462 [Camellia sinensis]
MRHFELSQASKEAHTKTEIMIFHIFVTAYKSTKKALNLIDSCWHTNPKWDSNHRALADCAVGFGAAAIGGKYGATYVVTDHSDDPINPKLGSLRYRVIQTRPLWIIFARDMVITLKNELMINSYKTIDGRRVKVEIAYGPCITIQGVSHVIVHGITIHDCKRGKSVNFMLVIVRIGCDAIVVFASSHIWIDHCCHGLIDVIHGSTAINITISNNYFTQQVMLFGHDDYNTEDKNMRIIVVFNHFGSGLIQRMPRVRLGYAHVANNKFNQLVEVLILPFLVKGTTSWLLRILITNR